MAVRRQASDKWLAEIYPEGRPSRANPNALSCVGEGITSNLVAKFTMPPHDNNGPRLFLDSARQVPASCHFLPPHHAMVNTMN